MPNRIAGITIEIDGNAKPLQKELQGIDKNLRTTQSSLKDVNKLLKFDPGNTDLLRQKQKLLNDAIKDTKDKLDKEKEALKQLKAADQTPEVTEQMAALQRQIADDENQLASLRDQSREFGSVAGQQIGAVGDKIKALGDKIKDAGEKLKSFGEDVTKKVTAPIVAVGSASVVAAVDFEDAMAKLSTIADTTAETGVPLEELQNQIMELSNQTGISASEIAENVYNAISAGQDTADAVAFVENATTLAKAGFTSSASALDILTTAMNAYGLESDDVSRVSDILINTQNLGKTTVDELASSMGKVIPTAKANGVQLEDLAGAYAIMTSNGISTAETTTYLNSMLNELGKQGSDAADAFAAGTEHIKEGGLTMAEAMDQGWELTDVLSILDEQAAESGTSISNMFGSAEAGKAATVLWDNAKKLNDAVDSMDQSAGATDTAFEKLDTTSQRTKITLNLVKNTAIDLGNTILEMLAPAFEKARDIVQQLKDKWDGLSQEQKDQIVKIAGIVAAVGPIIMIIGSVISGIGTIISVVGSLTSAVGAVVGFLGGPLTLAIGAAIAIGVLLWKNWDKIKAFAIELKDKVVEVWNLIKETITNVVNKIKSVVTEKWNAIKDKVTTTTDNMKNMISNKLNAIKDAYNRAGGGIKGIVSGMVEAVKQYFSAGFDFINTLTGGKLDALKEKFSSIFETVKTTVRNAIDAIKGIFNFNWSLPHIKLPHFTVSPAGWKFGDLLKGTIPSLSISWYKRAYDDPVIFTKPTVMATPYGLKGFGDGNGAEIVMGLNKLREMAGPNVVINMSVVTQPGQDNRAIAAYVSKDIMQQVNKVKATWR